MQTAVLLILLITISSAFIIYSRRARIVKTQTLLNNAMLDAAPLCCHVWDKNFVMLGCNAAAVKLYGFDSKKEYLEKWAKLCSPEYQPDGRNAHEKMMAMVEATLREGKCVFEWMQQMPDGTPIPTEMTLVRVSYKNGYLVAGYTRDLRVIKEMEEKAEEIYYDALTGIFSRRYLDEKLTETIKSLSRSQGYLSLMMIKIDHFEKYNELYGKAGGDRCLKNAADFISKSITRETDFAARYSNKKLTVVLPYTDESGAKKVADHLIKKVREAKIPHTGSDVNSFVTISIGVATGRVNFEQTGGDYIKRAEEMLYISKEAGRDRYTFAKI